jgi:hypothetical protein
MDGGIGISEGNICNFFLMLKSLYLHMALLFVSTIVLMIVYILMLLKFVAREL